MFEHISLYNVYTPFPLCAGACSWIGIGQREVEKCFHCAFIPKWMPTTNTLCKSFGYIERQKQKTDKIKKTTTTKNRSESKKQVMKITGGEWH